MGQRGSAVDEFGATGLCSGRELGAAYAGAEDQV